MVVLVPCGTGPVQAKVGQHLSAVLPSLSGWVGGGRGALVRPSRTNQYSLLAPVWECGLVCLVAILFFFCLSQVGMSLSGTETRD